MTIVCPPLLQACGPGETMLVINQKGIDPLALDMLAKEVRQEDVPKGALFLRISKGSSSDARAGR